MPVVRVAVLAAPGVDRDPVLADERRRDIVLRRERVRRRERDGRAARLEGAHEVGGLGRHVQARADPQAPEWLLGREPLADQPEDGHLALRPLDPPNAALGQTEVGHVVRLDCGHRRWDSLVRTKRRSADAMSASSEPTRCPRRSSNRMCSA